MKRLTHVLISVVCLGLVACANPQIPVWKQAVAGDGPGELSRITPAAVEVTNLPKSRSGNRAEYEVFGIRYAVLDSAHNFRERGTASWYGSKFHGNATASGEIYDMYTLSAAHKHLPLPTFVRVTRVDNGKSIIVKVNDRGPFVGDRIIDLSYAAAASLDMLGSGTAEVLVEALSHHETAEPHGHYVQVGAFSDAENARRLMERVSLAAQLPVKVDYESARQIYRVNVGPLHDEVALDTTLQRLAMSGFTGYPVKK